MARPQPLPYYLRVEKQFDRELATVLRDAARHSEKAIKALGDNPTFSNRIRAAQFQLIQRELLEQSADLWGGVSTALNRNLERSGQAAAQVVQDTVRPFWDAVGGEIPEYNRARLLQATSTIEQYRARTANGISLSEQVYRTRALADGYVDRAVNRGLLLGKSAKEIAKDVSGFIKPDTPGGVSYAAMRLGRTELNNAFHTVQIQQAQDEPWTTGIKWNLSGSHPKADECDEYANEEHVRGRGPGVFAKGNVPKKPHPQCLCFTTSEQVDDDEFFDAFFRGDYDNQIDEVLASSPSLAPTSAAIRDERSRKR